MKRPLLAAVAALLVLPAAPLRAEVVFVKYRGTLDLAPLRCDWVTRSSLVQRLCFDPRNQYVVVSLKGTYYHYCGVPADVVAEWKGAESMGRYFNAAIKGR